MEIEKQEEYLISIKPLMTNIEKFALNLTFNRDVAKDLISEALLITYENFEKIKDKEALLSYLFTIISRLNRKNINDRKRFVDYDKEMIEHLFCIEPNQEIETDIRHLYDAMKLLPVKLKEALLLQEIFGMSQKEIALIQNTNIALIKVRVSRAKKKLRKILGVKDE